MSFYKKGSSRLLMLYFVNNNLYIYIYTHTNTIRDTHIYRHTHIYIQHTYTLTHTEEQPFTISYGPVLSSKRDVVV